MWGPRYHPLGPPHRRRVERRQQGGPRRTSSVGSSRRGARTCLAVEVDLDRLHVDERPPDGRERRAEPPLEIGDGPWAEGSQPRPYECGDSPQGTPRRWMRRARPPWTPAALRRPAARVRGPDDRPSADRMAAPGVRPTPVRPTIAPPQVIAPRATRSPCEARTSWLPDHRPVRRGPRRRRQTTSGAVAVEARRFDLLDETAALRIRHPAARSRLANGSSSGGTRTGFVAWPGA